MKVVAELRCLTGDCVHAQIVGADEGAFLLKHVDVARVWKAKCLLTVNATRVS